MQNHVVVMYSIRKCGNRGLGPRVVEVIFSTYATTVIFFESVHVCGTATIVVVHTSVSETYLTENHKCR